MRGGILKIVVNHIIVSAEIADDQGIVNPVSLIFKKEDLTKAPVLIQEMFSNARRYLFHNPPSPHRGEYQPAAGAKAGVG